MVINFNVVPKAKALNKRKICKFGRGKHDNRNALKIRIRAEGEQSGFFEFSLHLLFFIFFPL